MQAADVGLAGPELLGYLGDSGSEIEISLSSVVCKLGAGSIIHAGGGVGLGQSFGLGAGGVD